MSGERDLPDLHGSQILKSSSLMGGAQGINLLLGMVRTKFAAVLIGPLGVGLLGNYMAIQGMVVWTIIRAIDKITTCIHFH